MLRNNKFILGMLALAISTSIISYKTTITASAEPIQLQLGAYNTEKDKDLPLREATDENGITWSYKLLNDGTIYLQYAKNIQANMEVPEKLGGRIVSVIGDIVEYKSPHHNAAPLPDSIIQSVKIPSSVRFIGPDSFRCKNLTDVQLPNTTWVSERAFIDTPWLNSQKNSKGLIIINNRLLSAKNQSGDIRIPSNVKEIANDAFADEHNITSVAIPNSVLKIGSKAFSHCDNMKKITLPNGITEIKYSTFEYCSNLESIELPNDITEIGNRAFEGCSKLKNVIIPDSVTQIGSCAFAACSNLKNIKISNNKIHLENGAFSSCEQLTDVDLPSSASIEEGAFSNTPWLGDQRDSNGLLIVNNVLINAGDQKEDFKIPDNVTAIGSCAFKNWTDLSKIQIPDSVTEIRDKAFSGCINLNNIIIPDSVTKIGESAFEECTKLQKIEIPGSVKEIGSYAFISCSNLKNVILNEGTKTIGTGAFNLCKNIKVLEIPSSVINTYQDTAFDEGVTIIKNGTSYVNKDPYNNSSNKKDTTSQTLTVESGWHKEGDYWYWLWSDGTKRNGWYEENGNWFYFYGNGQMATGFINLNGAIYYLNPNSDGYQGAMKTGWNKINGYWYYFNPLSDGYKGLMARGWLQEGGNWYYFYYDGTMAANTTINGYYVNSSGAWVR
ncbi:hypothetical protein UT300005_10320 [Clostridium sp. CTA-5]